MHFSWFSVFSQEMAFVSFCLFTYWSTLYAIASFSDCQQLSKLANQSSSWVQSGWRYTESLFGAWQCEMPLTSTRHPLAVINGNHPSVLGVANLKPVITFLREPLLSAICRKRLYFKYCVWKCLNGCKKMHKIKLCDLLCWWISKKRAAVFRVGSVSLSLASRLG